jgi:hypothetical protein
MGELHNLYPLPNIVRMIKSRRMRWAGHVAHMGEIRNAYNILVGKLEGKRDHSVHIGIDGTIALEQILGKQGGKEWSEFIWLKKRTSGVLL